MQRGLEPDLTLLLDAPPEVGRQRIVSRSPDHFERERAPFFERVRRAYLHRAQRDPKRIKIIDASAELESVQRDVIRELNTVLEAFER